MLLVLPPRVAKSVRAAQANRKERAEHAEVKEPSPVRSDDYPMLDLPSPMGSDEVEFSTTSGTT